jgi:hypothetical protein
MNDLINLISETYRRRTAWHKAEKSLTLQAMAQCRRLCLEPFDADADEKAQKKRIDYARTEGVKLFAAVVKGADHLLVNEGEVHIRPFLSARDGIEKSRTDIEKVLAKLAKDLPVAPWIADVKGVAHLSLAAIIGEAGDLCNYSNPAKLWKRFGLAVMPDGRGQRKVTDAEAALAQGYAPQRRSIMWNIGSCIMKAQVRKPEGWTKETDDGRRIALGDFGQIYLDRRAYEEARNASWAHKRAQRYMEKRFLRELWIEWRKASGIQA